MSTDNCDQAKPCALCQLSSSAMNRVAGLDLCDPCFQGGASGGAGVRGWTLDSRSWLAFPLFQDRYRCAIEGDLQQALSLSARCRVKTIGHGLLSHVLGLRTPDPLFNRVVYVRSSTPEAMGATES